jgi:hypothetical protein
MTMSSGSGARRNERRDIPERHALSGGSEIGISADLGTRAEAGDCKNLDSAWTDFAISATRPKADIEIWSLFDIFHRWPLADLRFSGFKAI